MDVELGLERAPQERSSLSDNVFVTSSGVQLSYRMVGNADAKRDLVFCNGLFTGMGGWAQQVRFRPLAEQSRMILFDYRCQGDSDAVTQPFGIIDVVQDAAELLLYLGVERPVLLGHSFGGIVALGLAACYRPQLQARGLVLANVGNHLSASALSVVQEVQAALDRAGPGWTGSITELQHVFGRFTQLCFGAAYLKRINRFGNAVIESYARCNRHPGAVSRLIDAVLEKTLDDPLFLEVLEIVEEPALVITGSEDSVFPEWSSQSLADALTQGASCVIEGAGHSSLIEQRLAFNRQVQSFLEQHSL